MAQQATLYWFDVSHPAQAVRLMLEHKRIDYRTVDLMPGLHPVLLRLVGFRGGSVPALKINGRRVQGSLVISRVLEDLRPHPPLFPANPERRRAVEEAERWGEQSLQPIARRVNRWILAGNHEMRRSFASQVGIPAPWVAAVVMYPIAHAFARISEADDAMVRADLECLPRLLDRVDALIADGVIGGDEPNAADFQIGAAVHVLLAFSDLRRLVEHRPCWGLAMRLLGEQRLRLAPALPPSGCLQRLVPALGRSRRALSP